MEPATELAPRPWASPPPLAARPPLFRSYGRNALLFLATALSVYLNGLLLYGEGTRLAVGLLSILLAHEMGHYIACRCYGVEATLPFFLPAPWVPVGGSAWMPLSPVGTFGAFIRIRGPIPHRRALFDIGIAGPLAGFAVCLVVLLLGIVEAEPRPYEASRGGIFLGEPLLFQWATRLVLGDVPPGMTLALGPLGMAAWFGLFVTALNLIPIGQLDGGHIAYALLREKAALVSRWGWWICVLLIYFSPSWILWSILVRVLGRRHPRTLNDSAPAGRARAALGVLGLAVFVGCFVPEPFLGSWESLFEALGLAR